MAGRQFFVESWGDRLSLSVGGRQQTPEDPALEEMRFTRVHLLMAELERDSVRRVLLEVHHELTGQRLRDAYDPFHVDGEVFCKHIERSLQSGLARGLLDIRVVEKPRAVIRVPEELVVAPEMRPKQVEESFGDFQALFLDHTGAPISGLEVTLSIFGKPTKGKTDSAGVVTFEHHTSGFASLKLKSDHVASALEAVWAKAQPAARFEGAFHELRFRDELPDVQLELGVQRTVVIQPEVGRIEVELRDKTGRVAHALLPYEIRGPLAFEGETDDRGRLLHEDVPPGDYALSFTQSFDEELGIEPKRVDHATQLVVLGAGQSGLQQRWLGAVPEVRMARLRGMVFDTNKTFLLPTAIAGLKKIRDHYEAHNPSRLLIVGHTDTSGEPSYNDKLSKERAESVLQYLTDDVEAWLKNYDNSDQKKRWGAREDRLMMTQLEGFVAKPAAEPPVLWYQKHHNARAEAKGCGELKEDGITGPKTRGELVRDYMALDGVTLSEQEGFLIDIEVLGCGENFPLDATGHALDERLVAERDNERDPVDRRVELFFFDDEFGVAPKPSGPQGEEYLVWRRRAQTVSDEGVTADRQKATVVRLGDGHFQTGSAVLLPQSGGSGGSNGSAAKSAPFLLAMALRFNEERPGQSLLLGGHADSVGADKSNDKLSEKRGELVHAVLMGDRDKFVAIASDPKTGKVSDWKQILKWASGALPGFAGCDPGRIDDNAVTGSEPLKAFQRAYNEHKTELGASADDLQVDGAMGKKSWGALFDCYQFTMADELGEVEDEEDQDDATKKLEGLGKLRGLVGFLPTAQPFLAFGEKFPVDGVGKDNLASAPNRRVELLFFEQGHEPDVGILNEAPDVSELYRREAYELEAVEGSAKPGAFSVKLHLLLRRPSSEAIASEDYCLLDGDQLVHSGSSGSDGEIVARIPTPKGELVLKLANLGKTLRLALGVLQPLSSGDGVAGAQGRLKNLGYAIPEVSGQLDNETRTALLTFQQDSSLSETGDLDAATRDELSRRYGC